MLFFCNYFIICMQCRQNSYTNVNGVALVIIIILCFYKYTKLIGLKYQEVNIERLVNVCR